MFFEIDINIALTYIHTQFILKILFIATSIYI